MSTLSERLKSLGIQIGAGDLPKTSSKRSSQHTIEQVISGKWQTNLHGETFLVEKEFPAEFRQGDIPLRVSAPLDIIADWASEPRLAELDIDTFAFIDTETTGLMGGTGTYTFLIGVGRFKGDKFCLAQFFMQDPAEEAAQLTALENFLAPCHALVTFNGKAFDLPLINTRYITHGWPPFLRDVVHLDLLHLARRLWRLRLPSRALGDLEFHILGSARNQEDVPGWMIPQLYFDYLNTGDARPLRSVFYHNEMDIVSMAALLNHMSHLIAEPLDGAVEHALDFIALGKLYQDLGHLELAERAYKRGLSDQQLGKKAYLDGLQKLSFLHKKQEDIAEALSLWKIAADEGQIYAHVELAKVYEHRRRDYTKAAIWTQEAINLVKAPGFPAYERARHLPELEHRLERLNRKLNRDSK